MESKAKVFIASCNRLLRESIARVLAKKTDFEIVAAQAICSTTRNEVADSGANTLILDSLEFFLDAPIPSSGTGAKNRLMRSVLVAMDDNHDHFLAAIRHGALGYVLQEASALDVVSAIRTVAAGDVVCPPRYVRVLFEQVAQQAVEFPSSRKRMPSGLTRREQQLIPLIGRGLSNKEIASHFGLSEQTVKNHIHRILRKVGVADRSSVWEACQNRQPGGNTKSAGHAA
ncbi:MAG: response regulator transcription factor [Acidobacteriia bacterium]|nr:response regulator transcription factor [Terriglobia bacterium]